MADQSVFSTTEENPGQPAQQQPVQSNPFADQLSGIVNEEGKQKYETVDKALEGLANAQSYIPQLKDQVSNQEAEIIKLKAELEQRNSVEEVVSRLAPQNQAQPEPQATPQAPQGMSEEQVAQIVQNINAQNQQQTLEQSNKGKVNAELVSRFGDKAGEVVTEKAVALGTTPQQLEQMAATNPDVVLALFNSSTPSVKPTSGSVTIPSAYDQAPAPLERPTKSLLAGATSQEQKDFLLKAQADVYAKFGVTQ